MTHIPFQPWCVVCQEAKGRASQHKQQRASTKTSKIQLDYAYIRQPQDKEPTTILTWVESLTGLAGSLMTTKKGITQPQLDAVVTFIKRQGFAQSTLQCDGEPALVKLVEEDRQADQLANKTITSLQPPITSICGRMALVCSVQSFVV